jgi:hypothetical protein
VVQGPTFEDNNLPAIEQQQQQPLNDHPHQD